MPGLRKRKIGNGQSYDTYASKEMFLEFELHIVAVFLDCAKDLDVGGQRRRSKIIEV